MTDSYENCSRLCRWFSIGVGVVALLLFWAVFGTGFFWALVLGVIIGVGCAIFLPRMMCSAGHGAVSNAARTTTTTGAGSAAAPGVPDDGAKPADAIPPDAEPVATAPATATSAATPAPLAGPAAAATTPGAAKDVEMAAERAGNDTPPQKPEADAAPAKPAPKAKKPAPATDAGTNAGDKPRTLDAPKEGGADNLKHIKGVGPKLEAMLNRMGFYHFDQIANWTDKEVAWVDQNLEGFKGRVSRDDWVAQAKILADGGETEFSKKSKGKG